MAKQNVTDVNGRIINGYLSIDRDNTDQDRLGVEIDGNRYSLSSLLDKYDNYDIKIDISNKKELCESALKQEVCVDE